MDYLLIKAKKVYEYGMFFQIRKILFDCIIFFVKIFLFVNNRKINPLFF